MLELAFNKNMFPDQLRYGCVRQGGPILNAVGKHWRDERNFGPCTQ